MFTISCSLLGELARNTVSSTYTIGVAKFDHRGMIGTIYNWDYQPLLHTKYRSSGPSGFREDFLVFPMVSLLELSLAMETTILIVSFPKPSAVNLPTPKWFTFTLTKISPLASEIFFFETVDR